MLEWRRAWSGNAQGLHSLIGHGLYDCLQTSHVLLQSVQGSPRGLRHLTTGELRCHIRMLASIRSEGMLRASKCEALSRAKPCEATTPLRARFRAFALIISDCFALPCAAFLQQQVVQNMTSLTLLQGKVSICCNLLSHFPT